MRLLEDAKKLGMGIDRAPAADRRRADERDQGGAPRPRHGHALLRPLRVAAQGLRRPAVSRRRRTTTTSRMRFGQVARLWDKIYPPGSPEWKAYLEEHLKLGTTFDPTLTIYSAGRDVMRFRARRVARQVHAAVADGLLHAEPRQPRRLLVRLDHRGRSRVAQLLPGLVQADERLQEDGRTRHDRLRLRASSTRPTASATSTSSRCCRKPASIRSRSSSRRR